MLHGSQRGGERPVPPWPAFAHYVAAGVVALTGYQLLLPDWRGYLIAWLALVAVANVYLSAYSRLRVEIHREKAETRETETRTRRAG